MDNELDARTKQKATCIEILAPYGEFSPDMPVHEVIMELGLVDMDYE